MRRLAGLVATLVVAGGLVPLATAPAADARPSARSFSDAAVAASVRRTRSQAPVPYTTVAYATWYSARRLPAFGWRAREMACLKPMWVKESDWDFREVTGKYRGIPQTTSGVIADYGFTTRQYMANPEVQVEVGFHYIRDRYGSPCRAWSFWQRHGWY